MTRAVCDVVATRVAKRPEVGWSVMLGVPCCEVVWLNVAFYSCIGSCELEWKRLKGEVNEKEVPGDDIVSDTDSLEFLLQRDANWKQETSIVDRLVGSVWESLKPESVRAQITISTTI